MNWLILIKHSLPVVDANKPAAQWVLSEAGRQRCGPLAQRVAVYTPHRVISSREPKASETGRLVAEQLNVPWGTAGNLHEHERPQPGLLSQPDFHRQIAEFFRRPDELVFGAETARQAQRRFCRALDGLLAEHQEQNLAVVAHGTVISLCVAHATGAGAFPLWQKLGLPSLVALSLPDFRLEKVIEDVQ
ncbi:MAG: histidine phosphatase family protein [Chloroflexota bacterium]